MHAQHTMCFLLYCIRIKVLLLSMNDSSLIIMILFICLATSLVVPFMDCLDHGASDFALLMVLSLRLL